MNNIYQSNFPGFKSVEIGPQTSAVTITLKENHAQLVYECLNSDGEYEINAAELRALNTKEKFSPGRVKIIPFSGKPALQFSDRTKTWQVDAFKAQSVWNKICKEATDPVNYPVYFHCTGDSPALNLVTYGYMSDDPVVNDIKRINPVLFHNTCQLVDFFDRELECVVPEKFMDELKKKVSLLDLNKLNYNALNHSYKYLNGYKDITEGYPVGVELYNDIRTDYNACRFNLALNKTEEGMYETFKYVKYMKKLFDCNVITKYRCSTDNCTSWAFKKIKEMDVYDISENFLNNIYDYFIKLPGAMVPRNKTKEVTETNLINVSYVFKNCLYYSLDVNEKAYTEISCKGIKKE